MFQSFKTFREEPPRRYEGHEDRITKRASDLKKILSSFVRFECFVVQPFGLLVTAGFRSVSSVNKRKAKNAMDLKTPDDTNKIGEEMYQLIVELYPICRSITGN